MLDRILTPMAAFALLSVLAAPAALGSDRAWIVGLEARVAEAEPDAPPTMLALTRASYEVEVLGSVALGTLVQEYLHDGAEPVRASHTSPGPGRPYRLAGVEIAVDGEPVAAEVGRASSPRARRPTPAPRRAASARTAAFDVQPGQVVTVRSGFRLALAVRDGRLQLALPPVAAPVLPLDEAGADPPESGGFVPVSVEIGIRHAEPLAVAESPTHEIYVSHEDQRTAIELLAGPVVLEGPFRLTFALGSEDRPTLLSWAGSERDGTRDVLVVLTPPVAPPHESIRPKQVLFVLDTSGSMARGKLHRAVEALDTCLEKLGEQDRFNVVEFDAAFTMLRPEPVVASAAELEQASGWLARLRAGGNTLLFPALAAAFEQPDDGDRHRMIVVLTDGNVSNLQQALELIDRRLGDGRLFVVGIGEDVREDTILRLAEHGRGTAVLADDPQGLDAIVGELFASIAAPLAWDLAIDWGGARVERMEPERVPDLYGGRPVTVRARLRGELPEQIRVSGSTMEGIETFTASLPHAPAELPPFRPAERAGRSRPPGRR